MAQTQNLGPAQEKKLRELVDQVKRSKFSVSLDDPDQQHSYALSVRDVVVQLQILAGPLLRGDAASCLSSLDIDVHDYVSASEALATVDAILPVIEDAIDQEAVPTDDRCERHTEDLPQDIDTPNVRVPPWEGDVQRSNDEAIALRGSHTQRMDSARISSEATGKRYVASPTTLYLFPDTNLFLQGKPLDDLDWSRWCDFDDVRIIICRPVQREIDKLKNGPQGRRTKLARRAVGKFREATLNDGALVMDKSPRVQLYVEPQHDPSQELTNVLDYNERDDQLVGTVHAFASDHPDCDVRLLTHDGEPLARAKSLHIKWEVIPDDWLLAPESSPQQKEIERLKARVQELSSKEPFCSAECLDDEGNSIERLETEHLQYVPLTETQVTGLLETLQMHFTREREFRKGLMSRGHQPLGLRTSEYVPPTQDEIEGYQKSYAGWVDRCRKYFSEYHKRLQRSVSSTSVFLRLTNVGTRPARGTRVRFRAQGSFRISMAGDKEGAGSGEDRDGADTGGIPLPPSPPQGRQITLADRMRIGLIQTGMLSNRPVVGRVVATPLTDRLDALLVKRDSSSFYCESEDPSSPQETLTFSCEQWRHKEDSEDFPLLLHCVGDNGKASGTVDLHDQRRESLRFL